MSLLFALDFADTDGDLGAGAIELEVADGARSRLPLSAVFAAQFPPLHPSALQGRLELYVEVENEVRSGERLDLAFVLEDSAERRSNRYAVTLEATAKGDGS